MQGKYLYCVAKELEPVQISATGVDGVPIGVVSHQDLSCVVSDTDFTDKELSKESALAHEKVLEDVMQYSPIVPIAFGHVARSEDEIKTKLLDENQSKLHEWLSNLEGKIELSLKAFWLDLAPILKGISETSSDIKRIKAKGKLSRDDQMRAGEIAANQMGRKREKIEDNIIGHFGDLIIEHKKCNLFGEQMITNLALLISKETLPTLDKKVNEYAEHLGDNVKLKYTGPVPPYNFVELNINLK